MRPDLVSDRDVAQHDVGDRRHPDLERDGTCKPEDHAPAIAGVRIAELELHTARHLDRRVVVQNPQHLNLLARPDLDADVLRRQLRESL